MLLELLREEVLHANQEISRRGLAPHTFGNASGIDRSGAQPLVVIKPSGVDYARLTPATWSSPTSTARSSRAPCVPPAIWTPTPCCTANFLRSAASSIPTPSSPPPGPRPPPDSLPWNHPRRLFPRPGSGYRAPQRRGGGRGIRAQYRRGHRPALPRPAPRSHRRPRVLVAGHAPFAWGKTVAEAVEHADVLEYIARLAFRSLLLNPSAGLPTY